MKERGYILGLVIVALVALSIGAAAVLTISGGEADLAGQVRKQKQLAACAMAGVDASIAKLPDTSTTSYALDPNLASNVGHYVTATGVTTAALGVIDPTLSRDLPVRGAGEDLINVGKVPGLGSGAAGVTRQAYRIVSTCTNQDGQKSEAERVILYGASR
jgi:hypothetical protein